MIIQELHCPHCPGTDIVRHGQTRQGKQQIVDMALNASGIRDTARVLHIRPNTVMAE